MRYGFGDSIPREIEFANAQSLVCLMIEELEAVRNLPEILKVEGVDVYFVGGGDLAQTMGFPGRKSAPEVQKVVCESIAAITAAGKIAAPAALAWDRPVEVETEVEADPDGDSEGEEPQPNAGEVDAPDVSIAA